MKRLQVVLAAALLGFSLLSSVFAYEQVTVSNQVEFLGALSHLFCLVIRCSSMISRHNGSVGCGDGQLAGVLSYAGAMS